MNSTSAYITIWLAAGIAYMSWLETRAARRVPDYRAWPLTAENPYHRGIVVSMWPWVLLNQARDDVERRGKR